MFTLTGRADNHFEAGEALSFGFADSAGNADKRLYTDFSWTVTMQNAQNAEAGGFTVLFVGANADNSVFTLYADEAKTVQAAATGDVHIKLTGKTAAKFSAAVIGDVESAADIKSVFLTSDTADADKDYVFYAAQAQYMEPLPEDFMSVTAYALPIIKINGIDFCGYTLKKIDTPKELDGKTYTCCWEITVPKEYITGNILIYANKHDITKTKNYVNMWEAAAGLVPYSEDEHMIGSVVEDADNSGKQAYYFYYKKPAPTAPHPIYSVNGAYHPLWPQPEYGMISTAESSVYKISGIKGNVDVSLGYNAEKRGSGNNEEALIELPSEAVKPGESYTFRVRTHEMNETQLQIYVSMGGLMLEPDGVKLQQTTASDELGTYIEYTVPSVEGDIIAEARSAFMINCLVKLEDGYNTAEKLKYSAFDYASAVLLNYSSLTHTGEFAYKSGGLSFELLNRPVYSAKGKANVDGTEPDPNTDCYAYDFSGSTMGGKPVSVTQYGGRYIVNNGGPITGDVIIKTSFSRLAQYAYTVAGREKIKSITNRETYVNDGKTFYTGRISDVPTYRYLFEVEADPNTTQKIYLRQFGKDRTIKRTYSISAKKTKATIYGDLIQSNIAVTALGADEVEVYAAGQKAGSVAFDGHVRECSFYYGVTAKRGVNFTFSVYPAAKITITAGGKTFKEGKEYTAAYDETKGAYFYTIRGAYMTADTEIRATSRYTAEYVGLKNARPEGKGYTKRDSFLAGTDYVFTLSKGSAVIKVGATVKDDDTVSGGRTLKKGRDYTVSDGVYTVFAKAITDNIVITVTSDKASSKGGGRYYGGYTSKLAGDVELEIGSEVFMTLDGRKTMYLVVAYGEPEDGRSVCFNNSKMIRSDSSDGYVWLEISDKDYDEFAEYAVDSVSLMYEREMREKLEAEEGYSGEKIDIPPLEEIHNLNMDYEVICDVNEDGKIDGEDLKLMRRMFNGDFEDFDDIPMRSFILADVDQSSSLDMRDAAMIKKNFDRDEDEGK